jgi:hypothetical protein
VTTTHLRGDDPARLTVGRSVLVGSNSVVKERFTLLSDTQLLYQFTMEDPDLYSQPWSGEFSLAKTDNATYAYSCHEGNYSLPGILIGGRMEQQRNSAEAN